MESKLTPAEFDRAEAWMLYRINQGSSFTCTDLTTWVTDSFGPHAGYRRLAEALAKRLYLEGKTTQLGLGLWKAVAQ